MKVLHNSTFAEKMYVAQCNCCDSIIEATRREVNIWKKCPVCYSNGYVEFYPQHSKEYAEIMKSVEEQE